MSELRWHKSSYSEAAGNACVEIAKSWHVIAVRDSKNLEQPHASVGREAWVRFTGAVAAGRFPGT
ncbi:MULTISPECIES: DUF397 domain-containing protein [Streptomyces]|uniref:DUF397 domain-containing protein n=1 Tax=Streptomyces dengpaensis TaxID=2049881 RepID=A0ABN5HYE5_9ACTN|nr:MULTISPECIES: DUF397 domain-containing protein [Streptomyces]AVH56166.1 DUF397 domain-containing protein [Streptomyces dengpaensis]PIB07124.1 hypothetical protein B1C81_20585 [Streptomyces sp. HG99]